MHQYSNWKTPLVTPLVNNPPFTGAQCFCNGKITGFFHRSTHIFTGVFKNPSCDVVLYVGKLVLEWESQKGFRSGLGMLGDRGVVSKSYTGLSKGNWQCWSFQRLECSVQSFSWSPIVLIKCYKSSDMYHINSERYLVFVFRGLFSYFKE